MDKKVILIILDGWGITSNSEFSAIEHARTPYFDFLWDHYSHTLLSTSGLDVGLPEGQMGNSEVGHMNLGAGRVVYQDLVRINKAIEESHFSSNPVLLDAFKYALKNKKNVHLIGLLSDGGVHSHIHHLKALCKVAASNGIKDLFIHAFTDGRDTDPQSSCAYIKELQESMSETTGTLASVIGRYYAMDRDQRWERIKRAYDLLVNGIGSPSLDFIQNIQSSYGEGITDEFLLPMFLESKDNKAVTTIKADDVVINFNFRTDRGRQLTEVLTQADKLEFEMKKMPLYYVTMTNFDHSFKNVKVLFDKDNLENTLGEILEKANKKQIRIAETEKYPHVTFFFSGGREEVFKGEKRLLCASPKVATYDLKPEMSAYEIKDAIIPELNNQAADFICLNFANPDMVGHTGDMNATIQACEAVDICLKEVVGAALASDYTCLVIADHGNAESMKNEDQSPNTAHTTNPVPCILVDDTLKLDLKRGKLANIAPTILKLMGLAKPTEMNENPLF